MTSETEARLDDALQIEDGFESVQRVKDIVSAALSAADPTARVVRTEYFNHTYIPDLVVEWPSRGVDSLRRIYLRPTQDPDQIEIDVKAHESASPMFVHLSELKPDPVNADLDSLAESARSTQSLVTQIGSFEELTKYSDAPGARLLPPSVLRGGRGLLESEAAAAAARTISQGFAGALEADQATTAAALETVNALLAPSTATEVNSVLETLWLASGGPIDQFPHRMHWSDPNLTPARLRALLRAVPAGLADFWKKVGEGVTLTSFDGMNILGQDRTALQSIMTSAVSRITIRTCRIVELAQSDQSDENLVWKVEHGQLSLQGFDHRCWIGQRNEDLPLPDKDDNRRPRVQVLVSTSMRSSIPITSMTLVGGGRTLTYGSQEDTDIIGDDFTASFAESLGPEAVVDRAVATIEAGKPVTIDYSTGTVFGRSNARLKASNLLWTTWTMLGNLDSSQWATFTRAIRPREYSPLDKLSPTAGWYFLSADTRDLAASSATSIQLLRLRLDGLRRRVTGQEESDLRKTARSGDTLAMLLLGMSLDNNGEHTEAEIWYRSAIDSNAGEAMVALASLLERHGEHTEAAKWYRRATLAIEP